MKEYAKKPENQSHNLDSNPKASRQAPIDVILQRYKERNIQRYTSAEEEELIQGKFDTAQRKELDEEEFLQGKFELTLNTGQELIQREEKPNNTGLPENLKTGVENLSGYSMDDVRVHYNSNKPAQLQALAYTQGTDIHVASGQEKHLPHEAWHVIQQKQGRVQPTVQLQVVNVNDDEGLEKEADVMGEMAVSIFQQKKQFLNFRKETEINEPQIAQLKKDYKSIAGLTHLVKLTDDGHLYNGENWLDNEMYEVCSDDLLLVNYDYKVMSRRGIDQQNNWKSDVSKQPIHKWIVVEKLNHKRLEDNVFVREEMLSNGMKVIPKTMHSIWVQGDYSSNEEATEGLKTRQGGDLSDWVNIIWLYNSGELKDSEKVVKLDQSLTIRIQERDFVREMQAWKERCNMPSWVENWLPILEILMEKRSYITMSDIMRMIILYYEGGVYMDIKIKVNIEKAGFKDSPKALINTACFYDAENWAIIANAGCKMIEDIMIQAFKQFPTIEELRSYPENYREQGKEGKTHVNLHENKGVWNVIDRGYRQYSWTPIPLYNPRKRNSWIESYEDRDQEVVLSEKKSNLTSIISTKESQLQNLEIQLKQKEEAQKIKAIFSHFPIEVSDINQLEDRIRQLKKNIDELKLNLKSIDEE